MVVAGLTGLSGCGSKLGKFGKKGEDKSDVQTLDNLARGENGVNPNECSAGKLSADRRVVIKEENVVIKGVTSARDTELRDHVYQIMGNIPQSVLTVFFALDGVVEVNKNSSAICRELQNSSAEPDASQFSEDDHLVSCWKRNDKGAATIYIDPNVMVSDGDEGHLGIDHGLIRSFGYVVAEMFLKLDITVDANNDKKWIVKELAEPMADDQVMLENLSAAFIKDVESSNGKYSLDEYQELIGGSEAQKQKFRFFVFAEAFDSYHCNAETRSLIASDFPKTYKAMHAVVKSLTEDVTTASRDGLELTSSGSNACKCFGGFGAILHGIFSGIGKIVATVGTVIKTVVATLFHIIMVPFKLVFGLITCDFQPLKLGLHIGTTPIRGGGSHRSPMQHPCQQNVTQKQVCSGPNQNGGGVKTGGTDGVTVNPKIAEEAATPAVTSTSTTDQEVTVPAVPATPAARAAKKKWYQCGTLGGDEMTGFAPVGIALLMALPLFGTMYRRKEE
jgi:hypothetical protein